jgi:hypothetical protein
MKEMWIAIMVVVLFVLAIGIVWSCVIFVQKLWEHINIPHEGMRINTLIEAGSLL